MTRDALGCTVLAGFCPDDPIYTGPPDAEAAGNLAWSDPSGPQLGDLIRLASCGWRTPL